jgi:LAGLIDADG DNA endonuclease family protein
MTRCDSCRTIATCPLCGTAAADLTHIGVRGISKQVIVPIIDYKITYDEHRSGIWHYVKPCGHRIHPQPTSVDLKYNGGPLWKTGYMWQNIYWGTYFANPASAQWIRRLELATTHLESDPHYSGGLSQYNVGMGKVIGPAKIQQDPPAQLSEDQVKKALTDWISSTAVANFGTGGAYNIFLPPGVTASLSTDLSCQTFCDYHDSVNGPNGPFFTLEPYPCTQGCNQCTNDPFDTLTQGLSEEMVELKTDMDPGTGYTIGNEELCVPPDTLLLGDNITIQECNVGGEVIGATGFQGINEKFERQYTGELIEIKAVGLIPFQVTPTHPVLTVRGKINSTTRRIAYDSPSWKKASELTRKRGDFEGDYLILPRIHEEDTIESISLEEYTLRTQDYMKSRNLITRFPLNPDTAWLLGLYVAEGSSKISKKQKKACSIQFSISSSELNIARRVRSIARSLGYSATIIRRANSLTIYIPSAVLARFFKHNCGHRAYRKMIPDFILRHTDNDLLKAFLDGYLEGDGHIDKQTQYGRDYTRVNFTTVSKALALQLQLAFARLGWLVHLVKHQVASQGAIKGKAVRLHESYRGTLYPTPASDRLNRLHSGSFYLPITSLKLVHYDGPVYNIGTQDHTYLVSNAIVHNCDFCDASFVCNQISTGEYVNSWFDKSKNVCWKGP